MARPRAFAEEPAIRAPSERFQLGDKARRLV
jgi:hypothetical protein